MNLANKLTIFRIILVPFFVALLLIKEIPYNYVWALIIFTAASITDRIDGQIARKRNMITDFGKFLDPIADKILTTAALICFIELEWIPGWTVIVVLTREFIVSGIRLVAVSGKNTNVIAADFPGKLKTAVTMVSVIIILIMRIWIETQNHLIFSSYMPDFEFYSNASSIVALISEILTYIIAALTVWSGAGYVWKYRNAFKGKM